MRQDNGEFHQRNTASEKRPHYVIEIAFDNDLTDFLYLTSHDNSEAPAAAITAGEVIYDVVRGISGLSQQIDPSRAVASMSWRPGRAGASWGRGRTAASAGRSV